MKRFIFLLLQILVLFVFNSEARSRKHKQQQQQHHELDGSEQFVFFMSTGRCGTTYLSKVLKSKPDNQAMVTFENEHGKMNNILKTVFHPAMITNDTKSMSDYTRNIKIPAMKKEMASSNKRVYVDTGHQVALGLLEPLIDQLSPSIKVVRLRRNRLSTAASFAGAPGQKDPCDYRKAQKHIFYCPFHDAALVKVPSPGIWDKLSLFQKYLWWVDEVEARWQRILAAYPHLDFIEIDVDKKITKEQLDKICEFTGLDYRKNLSRRTGINSHNRQKFGKPWMQIQDKDYKKSMGLK